MKQNLSALRNHPSELKSSRSPQLVCASWGPFFMPGSVPNSVPRCFRNSLTQFTCASKPLFGRDLVNRARRDPNPRPTDQKSYVGCRKPFVATPLTTRKSKGRSTTLCRSNWQPPRRTCHLNSCDLFSRSWSASVLDLVKGKGREAVVRFRCDSKAKWLCTLIH